MHDVGIFQKMASDEDLDGVKRLIFAEVTKAAHDAAQTGFGKKNECGAKKMWSQYFRRVTASCWSQVIDFTTVR